jgi:hypothetical protein
LAGVFLHPAANANELFYAMAVYFFKVAHQVKGVLRIEVETVGHDGEGEEEEEERG